MMPLEGYILTRERMDIDGGHRLRYAGVSDAGPFEVLITTNRPLFFIQRDAILPKPHWHAERRQVDLTDFQGRPVDALYFKTQNNLFKARKAFEESGIQTFESDVYPEERYLMERFIHGGVAISGPHQLLGGILRFIDPRISKAEYTPTFKLLSLDIETGQRGELYSIACHTTGRDEESGMVFMVDAATFDSVEEPLQGGGSLYRFKDEKSLLYAFFNQLPRLDPDIIIGWHVIGFDLLFLEKKCNALNIPFTMGRGGTVPKMREIRRGSYRIEMCGRVVIDGPPSLRGAFYSFDNFRLETVASELLGTGKDIGEQTDKVAEIERRFREEKVALARYNLMDCTLVTDIFKKTGLMDHLLKRAIICGLPMDRVNMSVAAFDHFMLPQVHRKGLVAINVKDVESSGQAKGGFVFSQEPGFYDHVVVLDFKSLYPSIIRTFHIDPVSRLRSDKDPLRTPVDISFSKSEHVLPGYIQAMMEDREEAKRRGDPHLSQAIKILMNSFYGVMGTPGCRFYHPDLPTGITGTGQWILKTTRKALEDRGYEVIYGDTDSVFVCLKETEITRAHGAALSLVGELNTFFSNMLLKEYGVISKLELEFEKHFIRFFLPAIRGGGESAKKRYAGIIERGGKNELVITGLEFVRSDWTRFARNFQYELFQRMFRDEEVESWLKKTVTDLKNHRFDADLVYKKRLTKPAHEYTKSIPPHVRAIRLLGDAASSAKESHYVMTLRGPMPVALPHGDLDYAHYIEKQLIPIFDAVALFRGTSYHQIFHGRQLDLFP